jgi:RNA polymerase sigma factor (sigma-70 family)
MTSARDRQDAWEEPIRKLFRSNSADILNYFARRVSPLEDAADLLGETLIIACRRPRTIPEDPERARMWFFGVARNVLRNYERGKRRHSALTDKLRTTLTGIPQGEGIAEVLDVRNAIASLKPDDRELVRLIYWDGFSTEQAAEVIGITGSTARGRMQKIKDALRIRLDVLDNVEGL